MKASSDICIGDLEVRAHEHVALFGGREVPLTSREFEMLAMLAEHPGWVFSANQLSGDPEEGDHSPESVSVLISRLRHKLAEEGASDLVETVRGVGYRLRAEGDAGSGDTSVAHADRALRDAAWQLQEAAIEVEHSGSAEQRRVAADVLERTRRELFSLLAK